jgi:two-component system response regulator YesN
MKAVIIDDEYWTRDSIRRLAQWDRFGIDQIEEAEDGLSGLSIIDSIHPDIVITDMKMRGMDGVELLRKLSENYPFIRAIVISGYDDFSFTKQAIQSKVDEYILKPIDPDELNRALAKAVRELQISRGLQNVHPQDKQLLKTMTEYKHLFVKHFQRLELDALQAALKELEQILTAQESLKPGMNNSMYKQLILILEEQANREGIDFMSVFSERAGPLLVTDTTPIAQWIRFLSDSYAVIIDEIINARKDKKRIGIKEIRDYIDRSYTEPITLHSIASQFFVSKEHLSRTFKQETGSTVMDYIITRRVDKAKELLHDPAMSIKRAAESVGYSDLTYFHRVFKKITGMTPGQVKHEQQG